MLPLAVEHTTSNLQIPCAHTCSEVPSPAQPWPRAWSTHGSVGTRTSRAGHASCAAHQQLLEPNHSSTSQTCVMLGSGKEVPAAHGWLLCQQQRCTLKARVQTDIVVETSSVASLHFDGLVNREFVASKAVSKIVLNFSFADTF